MGKLWLEADLKMRAAPTPQLKEIADKERQRRWKGGDALDPTINILAVAQFMTHDERIGVYILEDPEVFAECKRLLEVLKTKRPRWVIQNAAFDLKQLWHHMSLDFSDQDVWDTRYIEVLCMGDAEAPGNNSASLSAICKRRNLPEEVKKAETGTAQSNWFLPEWDDQMVRYATNDVWALKYVYLDQEREVQDKRLGMVTKIENKIVTTLPRIQRRGFHLDKEMLQEFMVKGSAKKQELAGIAATVFKETNLDSPTQMVAAIKAHYGIAPTIEKWDPKEKAFKLVESADKVALLRSGLLKEPEVAAAVAWKEIRKNITQARSWYDGPAQLFTEFTQLAVRDDSKNNELNGGTRTGRFSSSPNLQNISNFMKQFIIAPEGYTIVSSDYSGLEMRIMAHYAQDAVLKDVFNQGKDPHNLMAEFAFNIPYAEVGKKSRERRIAKECNFGLLYGMGGRRLAAQIYRATAGEVDISVAEASELRNKFFALYSGIARWHQVQFYEACLHKVVRTKSDRIRYYNLATRPKDIRATGTVMHPDSRHAITCPEASDWKWRNISYNTPIQGTGSDGIKVALSRLEKQSVFATCLTVHDSIDGLVREEDVERAAKVVASVMVGSMQLFVPDVKIEVEVTHGKTWASPPKNEQSDHGLWIRRTGFQQEIVI